MVGPLTRFADLPRDLLIETGTGKGDTIASALQAGFHRVISIERDERLHELARARFASQIEMGLVTLVLDDSAVALTKLIETWTPTVFWLDAHWSGSAYGEQHFFDECPLIEELAQIVELNWKQPPVILIDDARMFCDVQWWHSEESAPFDRGQWPVLTPIELLCDRIGLKVTRHGDVLMAR
jgi:hypothetical protein